MRLGGFEGGLVTVASVKLPHSLQIPNWFHLNSCWFSTWILTPAQKVMVHYLKHLSISSLSDKACFGGKKKYLILPVFFLPYGRHDYFGSQFRSFLKILLQFLD